jgi:hypothetical protein
MTNIKKIFKSVYEENPTQFKTDMESAIKEKIIAKINSKKEEITEGKSEQFERMGQSLSVKDVGQMKKELDKMGISAEQYAEDEYAPNDKEIKDAYEYFILKDKDLDEAKKTPQMKKSNWLEKVNPKRPVAPKFKGKAIGESTESILISECNVGDTVKIKNPVTEKEEDVKVTFVDGFGGYKGEVANGSLVQFENEDII